MFQWDVKQTLTGESANKRITKKGPGRKSMIRRGKLERAACNNSRREEGADKEKERTLNDWNWPYSSGIIWLLKCRFPPEGRAFEAYAVSRSGRKAREGR